MLQLQDFSAQFVELTDGWNWEIEGFLDTRGFVHPIDTDTKVLSTVFERLCSPVIRTIAVRYGYSVELSNQTTYPDFTLSLLLKDDIVLDDRVAIDIKTTYHSNLMGFTLGGYNSFLRNDTKNILYPYSSYKHHWVIGFIYKQRAKFQEYDLHNMPRPGQITCPYSDVVVFIREKHAITGLRAGSGNTKNIGSIKLTSAKDFATAVGPFMMFRNPKEACDRYWCNYEKYRSEIVTAADLRRHSDFRDSVKDEELLLGGPVQQS